MGALIAYRNWSDGAGSVAPWTFNYALGYPDDLQPVTGYPAENVRTRQLAHVARFERKPGGAVTGPCAVELVAAGSALPVRVVMVIGYGLPSAIMYKPSGSSYVSTPIVSGYQSHLAIPAQGFAFIPAGTDVESIRLYWDDLPIDYYEIGRIIVADALEFSEGVDARWSLAADDPGELGASKGRQWYESPMPRTRRLSVSVGIMDSVQAFGIDENGVTSSSAPIPSIQDLQMHAGNTGEVVLVPRTGPGQWAYRAGVYGHLERPPIIQHLTGPHYATSLVAVEER